MKNFMFIFRGPSPEDLKMTPEQTQAYMEAWFKWIGELQAKDRYVAGDALMTEGKTVSGKKMIVTDGPFAEGKELVGGYFVIKAESLDEATELTAGYPDFNNQGSVEVREVMVIPMS